MIDLDIIRKDKIGHQCFVAEESETHHSCQRSMEEHED